jgi:hypothetical protein
LTADWTFCWAASRMPSPLPSKSAGTVGISSQMAPEDARRYPLGQLVRQVLLSRRRPAEHAEQLAPPRREPTTASAQEEQLARGLHEQGWRGRETKLPPIRTLVMPCSQRMPSAEMAGGVVVAVVVVVVVVAVVVDGAGVVAGPMHSQRRQLLGPCVQDGSWPSGHEQGRISGQVAVVLGAGEVVAVAAVVVGMLETHSQVRQLSLFKKMRDIEPTGQVQLLGVVQTTSVLLELVVVVVAGGSVDVVVVVRGVPSIAWQWQ